MTLKFITANYFDDLTKECGAIWDYQPVSFVNITLNRYNFFSLVNGKYPEILTSKLKDTKTVSFRRNSLIKLFLEKSSINLARHKKIKDVGVACIHL